jgi:hypothetical protein
MVIPIDPVNPLASPLHPLNVNPAFAVALNVALCPLSYQFVPEGLITPAATGFTAVVKLYWVQKLAVYVGVAGEAVIV